MSDRTVAPSSLRPFRESRMIEFLVYQWLLATIRDSVSIRSIFSSHKLAAQEMIEAGKEESALARPLGWCKMQASMYSFDKRHENRPHYIT